MAGRPRKFSAPDALEKAANLFWANGYSASGTTDLLLAMGIERGSFYNAFKSKKAVYLQSVRLHEARSFDGFRNVLRSHPEPLELIKSFFRKIPNCPPEEHLIGCFAGNTIAELTGKDEDLATAGKQYLTRLESLLCEGLALARQKGQLQNPSDDELLARYLLNLWNGINITRRLYPDRQTLSDLIEFQLSTIN